jgi:transketolase
VLPKGYHPKLGEGVALTDGNDVAIFAYGPVMLSTAFHAAERLEADYDIGVRVINLPWLNRVDSNWLIEEVASIETLFSIDNHYSIGGQGDRILSALNEQRNSSLKLNHLALFDVPSCGTNKEVLEAHGFASESIVKSVLAEIG